MTIASAAFRRSTTTFVAVGHEVGVKARTKSRPQAAGKDQILDRDRHAGERADGFAARQPRLQRARGDPGLVGRWRAEGVKLAVEALHRVERGFDRLDRRDAAAATSAAMDVASRPARVIRSGIKRYAASLGGSGAARTAQRRPANEGLRASSIG